MLSSGKLAIDHGLSLSYNFFAADFTDRTTATNIDLEYGWKQTCLLDCSFSEKPLSSCSGIRTPGELSSDAPACIH